MLFSTSHADGIDGVVSVDPQDDYLMRKAMYACIPEIGRGFFEGVCAPCETTAHFSDPPSPLDSRISSPETFHPDACVAIALLRWLLVLRGRLGTQPQGDVGWLHRLPYRPHEVAAQCLHVRFVAQLGREPFQRLPGLVLAPVEATVDEGSEPSTLGDPVHKGAWHAQRRTDQDVVTNVFVVAPLPLGVYADHSRFHALVRSEVRGQVSERALPQHVLEPV
jgi:hypothetical protein